MFKNKVYEDTLLKAKEELRSLKSPNGFEYVVQKHLAAVIGNPAKREVPLSKIGAIQAWGGEKGRLDILYRNYGIELKVVRVPRIGAVPSNALYDIGQLSSDYWRIHNAKLEGGELCVLLYGCLVTELNKPSAILREFHNRMFLDFYTSLKYGELKTQSKSEQRIRQIGAIKEMGFDTPYLNKAGKKSVVNDEFALIIIPVKFS
ncbi:MAG: hypothetical protein D3907_01510 [Candidatus Electrothrix sp. AUS3]|nr:hypothetical protein [Candidatus Electrothrix gigas]